eukprot:TRINITY_DN4783_c0_g1_i1.p1 TRINITY_DN4783_c0_g1~~TRINITY_DN4783_c0_g1_i1.p1  ORF type:complete len:607 (+),score=122.83 TRINITY_DN4783_c0_g1_i1:47-1867(+)
MRALILLALAGTGMAGRCTVWKVSSNFPNVPPEWCAANCYAPGTAMLHPACDPATPPSDVVCICDSYQVMDSSYDNSLFEDLYAEPGVWLDIFARRRCDFTFGPGCSCSKIIQGASVDIELGMETGDQLRCVECANLGITAVYDANDGMLTLSGAAKLSTYVAALSSVQLNAVNAAKKKLVLNYGHAAYLKSNSHFYKYFSGPGMTWVEAQRACASEDNDILGLVGYLATITTEDEETFLVGKMAGTGWIGATDNAIEGSWRWVTGPEGCPPYDYYTTGLKRSACDMEPILTNVADGACTGPQCGVGHGSLLGQTLVNWASGEPNNDLTMCSGSCDTTGEDYGVIDFRNQGKWYDYPIISNTIQGYVCEWGGVGTLCVGASEVAKEITVLPNPCDPRADMKMITPVGTQTLPGVAVTEGMEGWDYGVYKAYLNSFPSIMRLGQAHRVTVQPLQEGTMFEIKCNAGCTGDACEVFLSVHVCNAACSPKQHGKLPGQLILHGWEASRCSPQFTVDSGDENYKMLTFRKVLLPTETVTTPPSIGPLNHVMLLSVPSKTCQTLDETTCRASNTCLWTNNVCIYAWCPKILGPHQNLGIDPSRCACPPTIL